jgi:hypothetical protein
MRSTTRRPSDPAAPVARLNNLLVKGDAFARPARGLVEPLF